MDEADDVEGVDNVAIHVVIAERGSWHLSVELWDSCVVVVTSGACVVLRDGMEPTMG